MKKSSRVKLRACRLNGALSRGPVTEEGKRRIAESHLYHGICSRQILLPDEPRQDFDDLMKQYIDVLHPRNSAELALVHEIVIALWRRRRLSRLETQLMNEYIPKKQEIWDQEIPDPLTKNGDIPNIDTLTIDGNSDPIDPAKACLPALSDPRLAVLWRHAGRQQEILWRAQHRLLQAQKLPKKINMHL
jgi:hypothetical protein